MARRIDTLGLWLGFAAALFIPATFGLARFVPGAAFASLFLAGGSILAGQAVRRALRVPSRPGFTAGFEVVAGFAVFAVLELLIAEAFRLGPIPASLLAAAAAGGLWIGTRNREKPAGPAPDAGGTAWDAAVLIPISLLAVLWSRQAMSAWRDALSTGTFPADFDFAFHATAINYLLRFPVFHGTSLIMAGSPHVFYHMGSYAPAAFFAAAAHTLTLEAALAFWLPAGIVLLGVAAYGFGSALGGRAAGTAAALGLLLLPDASRYGAHDAYFSFFWLLEVSPALGYGIAVVLAALSLFLAGAAESRFDLIAKGAALSLLAAFFKVQVAIPAAATFACLIIASWRPARPWHRWAVLGGLGAAAAAVVLFEQFPFAPHFLTGRYNFDNLFNLADEEAGPPFHGLYTGWAAHGSVWKKALAGIGLLLPGAFGVALPALLALSAGPLRPPWPRSIRAMPFVLLGVYLAGVFLVPAAGPLKSTEFSHRPFTLVYAVLVCAWAAAAAAVLRPWAAQRGRLRIALSAAGLALAAGGLAEAVADSRSIQTMPHYEYVSRGSLPPGFLAAAAFIRSRAAPADWVLASDGDPYAWVAALTERASYFSLWPSYVDFQKSALKETMEARFRLGAGLQRLRSYAELQEFGRKFHIRWFLLQPGEMARWPDSLRRRCVFATGNYLVFDLEPPEREPAS